VPDDAPFVVLVGGSRSATLGFWLGLNGERPDPGEGERERLALVVMIFGRASEAEVVEEAAPAAPVAVVVVADEEGRE
jgi:hypothetical protein